MSDYQPEQVDETGGYDPNVSWDPNAVQPTDETQYIDQIQETALPEMQVVVHETLRGLLRPAAAEFIGSALFVFVACGAGMTTVNYQAIGNVVIGIALTFGFMIFVLCFMIGHISGGHLNFAVTLTFFILRKISPLKCILYFLAQFLGGLVGIGFLKLITPLPWWKSCFANNFVRDGVSTGQAFLVEFILTFFLMFVVQAACDSKKSNQTLVPLAIGMAVFVCHMMAIPITGCSINPTRSFASSAAASGVDGCSNAWTNHWVFWFGPLFGAATGGILYEYVYWEGGYKVDALVDMYVLRKPHDGVAAGGGGGENELPQPAAQQLQ